MGKIHNTSDLSVTDLRRNALAILEAGLAAIDTETAIRGAVRIEGDTLLVGTLRYALGAYDRMRVFGVGKCSIDAARALEEILGDRLTDGLVIDIQSATLARVVVREGDHPMPSERNAHATHELLTMLRGGSERDLVLFVVSGGGSTLLVQPDEMAVADEAKILKALFHAGATIQEINTLRKHLSRARGGWIAATAYPATVAALVFSDVPGDDLASISSAPALLDATTVGDAEGILERFDVRKQSGVRDVRFIETPKEEKYFEHVSHALIVSNAGALHAMASEAERRGFKPVVGGTHITGEAQAVARQILSEARALPAPAALLYGGETTVTISGVGGGTGGRNQEASLAVLSDIDENELFVSCASDGRDNTDVAGALCDTITATKAKERGLDPDAYLAAHDSYTFFAATGDQVRTGPTGSNVADLIMVLRAA